MTRGLMDAHDDLILGVFANYSWDAIEAYAVSIALSGFRGRKVLLVWNLANEVRSRLKVFGFELIDVPPANMRVTFAGEFFRHRDKLVAEYLAAHKSEFRFVFWLDIAQLMRFW
jgi:hypothetical protein